MQSDIERRWISQALDACSLESPEVDGYPPEVRHGLVEAGELLFDLDQDAILMRKVSYWYVELPQRFAGDRLEGCASPEVIDGLFHETKCVEKPFAS